MSQTLPGRLLDELRPPSNTFVETGTSQGGGVQLALDHDYTSILSCEYDPVYFEAAIRRFAPFPNVHLFHGDSSLVLPRMLADLQEPSLLWLDAHHHESNKPIAPTGKCPLLAELDALLKAPCRSHTIMIDDLDAAGDPFHELPALPLVEAALLLINPSYTLRWEMQSNNLRRAILIASL